MLFYQTACNPKYEMLSNHIVDSVSKQSIAIVQGLPFIVYSKNVSSSVSHERCDMKSVS